jgi:hypothetical protein
MTQFIGQLKFNQKLVPGEDKLTFDIKGKCFVTHDEYTIKNVDMVGLHQWLHRGKLIQDALPNMPAHDREFLVSSISPKGWTELMDFIKEED